MNELQVLENNNERVLTTKQLAEVYETKENNIKNNFSNNKLRFTEGVHYYRLEGKELKEFKNLVNNIDLVDKRTPSLILWTEKGASRMCKILDTDRAWEQFDMLEETYFNVRENKPQLPTDYLSALKALVASEEEKQRLEKQIEEDSPFVKLAKERFAKGKKVSLTDATKSLGLKKGQITTYFKANGYLHKTKNEVNEKGKDLFKVYDDGFWKCIGILEEGIKFINEHLEDIKNSPCRFKKEAEE